MDEIPNLCCSMVHHLFVTEDHMAAPFEVVHAHDWLTSKAMVWAKYGRAHKGIFTIHSTEYGRHGNHFWGVQSARIREHERHGTYCA